MILCSPSPASVDPLNTTWEVSCSSFSGDNQTHCGHAHARERASAYTLTRTCVRTHLEVAPLVITSQVRAQRCDQMCLHLVHELRPGGDHVAIEIRESWHVHIELILQRRAFPLLEALRHLPAQC